MKQKIILYLRTDICNQELAAGGSVAHTVGVVSGFIDLGYQVVVASSCMHTILKKLPLLQLLELSNPQFLRPLRWKINCFLSSLIFFLNIIFRLKKKDIEFIYQRYSLLNITGLLLAWWYKKKLILEYNGSEAWIASNWIEKKRWIKFEWLMKHVELMNILYADTIVVVSKVLKEELLACNVDGKKILVNPNGVDTNRFKPVHNEEVKEYANNNHHSKKKLERHIL
jgi:glycosyltransferase involved in cell wall biosynthesis